MKFLDWYQAWWPCPSQRYHSPVPWKCQQWSSPFLADDSTATSDSFRPRPIMHVLRFNFFALPTIHPYIDLELPGVTWIHPWSWTFIDGLSTGEKSNAWNTPSRSYQRAKVPLFLEVQQVSDQSLCNSSKNPKIFLNNFRTTRWKNSLRPLHKIRWKPRWRVRWKVR